jgi:hypothetical protein
MADKEEQMREYQQLKEQRDQRLDDIGKQMDDNYKANREKYRDDGSTFGKVAKTSNALVYGIGKVLGFLIKHS